MAKKKKHGGAPGATPALRALAESGVAHDVHEFPHGSDHFGAEAADWLGEHLGVPAERIFKTLVISLQGPRPGLAVAVAPVPSRLNLKAAAAALGARKAELADPADAQRATGYVTGGISPLGQKRRLPTVIDDSAESLNLIYVSAGRRGLDVALSPSDLARLCGAVFAPVTA